MMATEKVEKEEMDKKGKAAAAAGVALITTAIACKNIDNEAVRVTTFLAVVTALLYGANREGERNAPASVWGWFSGRESSAWSNIVDGAASAFDTVAGWFSTKEDASPPSPR